MLRRCGSGCATTRPISPRRWRRLTVGCAASSAGLGQQGAADAKPVTEPPPTRPDPVNSAALQNFLDGNTGASNISIVHCTNSRLLQPEAQHNVRCPSEPV